MLVKQTVLVSVSEVDEDGAAVADTGVELDGQNVQDLVDVAVALVRANRSGEDNVFELVDLLDGVLVKALDNPNLLEGK